MRRLPLVALLVATAAALPGCSKSKGEVLTVKPKPAGLEGRMFFLAGESGATSDLYEGIFAPGLFIYRLTTTQRIGGITGCKTDLTVTNADQSVGFTDTIQAFKSGALSALAGLSDPKGSGPAAASDCRLVFDHFDRGTDPATDHLELLEPGQTATRELYAPGPGKVLGIAAWGPDGRVAVFEGSDPTEGHPTVASGIVLISPNGAKRVIPPPIAGFGNLQWGPSKWMAISDGVNKKTVFLDPDSGTRTELPGWFPLAWSPDGQQLMVTDSGEQKTLALVDVANLTSATVVGHAKHVGFYDMAWVPFDATAGGPPPVGRRADDGD